MLNLQKMTDETTTHFAISPQVVTNAIQGASAEVNPHPGFFAGARNVDASHGVFTDVGRDVKIEISGGVNIKVEMQVCCEEFEKLKILNVTFARETVCPRSLILS
jgi:uncharacterized alkaline shock family protein YloU